MSVAKRAWEGHILKGGSEIGFVSGTISIDRGLQTWRELGNYDIAERREAAREITGTIEHGYISQSDFMGAATGASITIFKIEASMSDHSLIVSGVSIETYDFEVPTDGWITESISWRGKTFA